MSFPYYYSISYKLVKKYKAKWETRTLRKEFLETQMKAGFRQYFLIWFFDGCTDFFFVNLITILENVLRLGDSWTWLWACAVQLKVSVVCDK